MKQYFFISLILMLLGISSEAQSIKKEALNDSSVYISHKQTEIKFTQAIQGTPLVIPLPEESDPTLFLMPVSDNDTIPTVDRLYIVDGTREKFSFERDIYKVDRIERTEETIKAVVSSIYDGNERKYEIDGFLFHEIWLINSDKWEYSSNIKIPVIKLYDLETYKPHRAEK
jgi:hypothetical protein